MKLKKDSQLVLLFALGFIMTFSSCTSELKLSQSDALEKVQAHYANSGCYSKVNQRTLSNKNYYQKEIKSFRLLQDKGLATIKLKNEPGGGGFNAYTIATWEPTALAVKDYKHAKRNIFKVTETTITEVTGISVNQEAQTAIVKFNYQRIPTAFYDLKRDDCPNSPGNYQLEFVKFDTGWEVKTN